MRRLGLIGGMSWESTLEYYSLINHGVKAALGGHHSAPCTVYSVDFAEIERFQREGRWDEMGEVLADAATALQGAGADGILLCTNTMHKVAPRIVRDLSVPFLHIADATADAVKAAGLNTVGLLGTRYTMQQAFYKDRLIEAGLQVLIPEQARHDAINAVIFDELCLGRIEARSRDLFKAVIADLTAAGAQGVILGCTEIGLLIGEGDVDTVLFDTTAIHAAAAVRFALGAAAAARTERQPA